MSVVGDKIREIRTSKGLSQEYLAKALGTSKATISRYEKGTREPRMEQLENIAIILNTPISNFLVPESVAEDSLELGTIFGTYHSVCNIVMEDPEVPERLKVIMREQLPNKDEFINRLCSISMQSVRSVKPDDTVTWLEEILLNAFDRLNIEGQKKAIGRVEELTEVPKYQRQEEESGEE